MKKIIIILAMLLLALTTIAQEKYYGQIKKTTKISDKNKTEVLVISIAIDEEYKTVSVSMVEPLRYKIVSKTTDPVTLTSRLVLELVNGSGLLEAYVRYDNNKAYLQNTQNGKEVVFDSRERPSIKL